MIDFLADKSVRKGRWRQAERAVDGLETRTYWTGHGRDAIEVAFATSTRRLTTTELRDVWKARQGRSAAPLLMVVAFGDPSDPRALACGPAGESPPVVELDLAQAERLASAALDEANRHLAARLVSTAMERVEEDVPGLRNRGLLATHELVNGVPQRADWAEAVERGRSVLGQRDHDLVRALGYEIEGIGKHQILRTGNGNARAVAVFLQEEEQPDTPAYRFDLQTPVTYALTQADRENLPWVVSVRARTLRLYSTTTSGAAGQRGRTETYVEVDLSLLPTHLAGYVHLLFSSQALSRGGTFYEVRQASMDFTAGLSGRLRDRVYEHAVPRLALAVAKQVGGTSEEDLQRHYHTALTILFRLLFLSYAEDSKLLPLHVNGEYTDHSLKETARRLADAVNAGRDLGFDDPLTERAPASRDDRNDDLWTTCLQLFDAVDKGHTRWGVPAYNGGLFSSDPKVNPVGDVIGTLDLSNAEFGPALLAMVVDRTPDGDVGPIDFRSLSVREFGTIYEGLLESELSVAEQDLTLGADDTYLPAGEGDEVAVSKGEVYLHNASGQRKASGSYFTKPFAVDHLLDRALEPTLTEHLARVAKLFDEEREADAADALFDFRVADVSMGSGHFLTAVVDRIEARMSGFLAEHPIPRIDDELQRLRKHALEALGDAADKVEIETASLLRRLVARRCVYGVDVNPIGVELARVSMWIHTFVPGLPLSFLNHNLVAGDSLTGIATIEEASRALAQRSGMEWGLFNDPLAQELEQAEEPLHRLARLVDATPSDIAKARETEIEVRQAIEPVAAVFDTIVAARIGRTAWPVISRPDDLHELVGDKARGVAQELGSLHFPIAFPEVYLRDNPGFDVIVGNPPWEEPVVEERAFWARHVPGLRAMSQAEALNGIARIRRDRPDLVAAYEREVARAEELRALLAAGPFPGMGTGDPDLYKAFCWRFVQLGREGGAIGVVLPRSVFTTKGSAPWRRAVLPDTAAEIVTIRNVREWAFTDVNPGYTVCLVVLRDRGRVEAPELRLFGRYTDLAQYRDGMARGGASVPVEYLVQRDGTLAVPDLDSDGATRLFASLLGIPGVGASDRSDVWVRPVREFDAAVDRHRTGILRPEGDHPVFNHRNIGHLTFMPGEGEFIRCEWKVAVTALQEKRLRSGTSRNSAFRDVVQVRGVEWLRDKETLPVLHSRIAFRDVVHATNKRKVWAALVPARTVLTNTAPYLVFARGDVVAQAFVLGMLNSAVCDWYAHLFVGLHLNYFIFNALPVPVADSDDVAVERVAEIAATLAVREDGDYGPFGVLASSRPTSDDERLELVAELDGIASILYDLDDAFLPLVWNQDETLRPPLETVKRYRTKWSAR